MEIALPWIQRREADKLKDAKSGYTNFKSNVPPSASEITRVSTTTT
jgi:hypothetical protein